MDKRYSQIIIKPIITEKSAQLAQPGQYKSATAKYTFAVTRDANKVEIKKAVEELIKQLYPGKQSQVLDVNTSAVRERFSRRRRHGRFPKDSKKAIVTIGGEALDLFEA